MTVCEVSAHFYVQWTIQEDVRKVTRNSSTPCHTLQEVYLPWPPTAGPQGPALTAPTEEPPGIPTGSPVCSHPFGDLLRKPRVFQPFSCLLNTAKKNFEK